MNCTSSPARKNFGSGFKLVFLLCLSLVTETLAANPDFIIETPNSQFNYRVNGVDGNPTITLLRGHSYTFLITNTASFHPCAFAASVGGSSLPGVSGDRTSAGVITYTVPANAGDGVYYCTVHSFKGTLHVIDAPPAPTIRITHLTVGTNLTLTAAIPDTNGLLLVPEFQTNLLTTNWFALTIQTNRYANGTNEAICGKPPSDAVFIRIRANQN